jgi:GT2 family glycosyltransferase
MKNLAIVICNFNKQEYVLRCIDSVLKSSYTNFDIYVVDNASSDNSVELIKKEFNDKVILIVNEENKGGSGGFNTGIREALKKEYEYMMLLDNDVVIDKNAIRELLEYLENNKEAAVAGSKIYSMDNPYQIQELGANVDFENYLITPFYKGYIDDGTIPEIVECQYVPACSMMVRVSAIKTVGLMAEENFIYWDDIDWGYRFILKGYKVVALSKSIVWHKMGVAQKTNTFGTYYFWRNRVKFFMTYCNYEQSEKFAEVIFEELFQSIYMCNYIGKYSSATTILNAILDAINGINGKANDRKIIKLECIEDKFKEFIVNKNSVAIIKNSSINHLRDLINKALEINPKIKIKIFTYEDNIEGQFFSDSVSVVQNMRLLEDEKVIISTCNHILDLKDNMCEGYIYIDKYFNIVQNNKEIDYINNYDREKELFKNIVYPLILKGIIYN